MLSLGPITFAAPWALVALAFLPVLWWLLRMTPPAPRRVRFPPVRFLAALVSREESVARTPWWLVLLRLALVLAIILGCAQPLLNAQDRIAGSGPIVLVIDDGWAAAKDWDRHRATMLALAERAQRAKRPLVVVTTAPESAERPVPTARLLATGEGLAALERLQPKPWPSERAAAAAALDLLAREQGGLAGGEIFWLSDGLEMDGGASSVAALAARLQRMAPLTVLAPRPAETAVLLLPARTDGSGFSFAAARGDGAAGRELGVLALADAGLVLARERAQFAPGSARAELRFRLPAEMSKRIVRFELEDESTAGGVVLVDDRWQRRPVGIVGDVGAGDDVGSPLLGQLYYLDRALEGFAEVRHGDIATLLARDLALLVLPDRGRLDATSSRRIEDWVEGGGVLVRFAGPRLAGEGGGDDPLLPVRLRAGDRSIGGALSWQEPAAIASFEMETPFAGLIAAEDIVIHRQVLAEPSFDPDQLVWARLDDGTPLVSARKKGAGWLVLFHTTANADWSNLPLSGLFVEMLGRLVELSHEVGSGHTGSGPALAPLATLDGAGALTRPPPGVRSIGRTALARVRASPQHPPGLYGSESERFALNLGAGMTMPRPIGPMPAGVRFGVYGETAERPLHDWLLGTALALALLDLALSALLRGLVHRPGAWPVGRKAKQKRTAAGGGIAAGLILMLAVSATPAAAQAVLADGTAAPAALVTRLAFIATGDSATDAVSRAGLDALAVTVNQRTAAELGSAVAVDPAVDELAFYPLLYWSLRADPPALTNAAAARLIDYIRNGGTIVFDMADDDAGYTPALRELARRLDLPPLVPVPADHVLRRAYYLLADLPGRYSGNTVWVVDRAEQINDGVTPVIAGSNDWAGAWAADAALRPLFPVVPGGEDQRELAYRFGINLVMYVLTGNYKADQVHLPAIMERLGQ